MSEPMSGPAAPFPYRHVEAEESGPHAGWTSLTIAEYTHNGHILQVREAYPTRQLTGHIRAMVWDLMRAAMHEAALDYYRKGLVR